ncbi:MAG: bifunctional phosphoribosyl-AMP cyclohydrolase/phosphoribosyl-ATP diphosphatase HisIE [Candidatus Izemoplasmataceae bacterium]
MNTALINDINYNDQGLIPVIVQEASTKEVLMLAYMNEEALTQTIKTKKATYYSRSRQTLWVKGESSSHTQEVIALNYDCDQDALLLRVSQKGPACHTNNPTCFYREIALNETPKEFSLDALYKLILERKASPLEKSYTSYLFEKGIDKILKKIGEEASEIIIAAKNQVNEELIYELSDFVFHALVLMVEKGVVINDLSKELAKRAK